MTTEKNGNAVSFKWMLGIAGAIIMILIASNGFLLKAEQGHAQKVLDDHEIRIRGCEQTDARREQQLLAIKESLLRLELKLGTLPDTARRR